MISFPAFLGPLPTRSALLILAFLLCGFGAASPHEAKLIAGPLCTPGEKPETTARVDAAGITFEARPLTLAEWEARLEKRVSGMKGILRRRDGSPPPFQVFLLAIRNHSPEPLRFQPGNIVRIGAQQQDHILDYTDLYRFLEEQGKNPDALDGIRESFFDSGLTLERADSIERLLFFRELPVKGKKKQLVLLLSAFQVGTETLQASLPWHFEKERK